MFKERLVKLIIISGSIVIVASFIFISLSSKVSSQDIEIKETTDIIYISNLANRSESSQNIINTLSLIDWNLAVFGGLTTKNIDGVKSSIDISNTLQKGPVYFSKEVNGILNIFLDTQGDAICDLGDEQLEFLRMQVERKEPVKILYMYRSMYANNLIFANNDFDTSSQCNNTYWVNTVEPIIREKVDVVISGDAEGFNVVEHEGIQYVQNGLPKFDSATNLLQFTRIQVSSERIIINKMSFGDVQNMDIISLEALENYSIATKGNDLLELYNRLPFYNHITNYSRLIVSGADADEIQVPIETNLTLNSNKFDAEFSVRGNLGNHWENFKKSWDIQVISTDARQLKLILPSDRHYLSQIFAEYLNDDLGVLTPHIEVIRLIVDDIDMGPYLLYEDFDKAFIELNGYNSDASTSRSLFLSHDLSLSVYENPNYIDKSGNSVDKTYQQKYSYDNDVAEQMMKYFDQDYTAKWIALQIFSGDGHQNNFDNNRFFLDKATGKYIMVTWDQWFRLIDPTNPLTLPPFQQAFYSIPENKTLVLKYLSELISHEKEHKEYLNEIIGKYNPIFMNDPLMIDDEVTVNTRNTELLEIYDKNIITLKAFIDEETK